ncbi:vWA domain-containing protein [Haloarchaeobius sp. DFWS5]|uniref:vWA domain-containing protein n=1 Tax=Haloarchaeobius sp. DFWS5 TaxID=3446114 RepID=UPI003EBE526E
MSHSPSRRLTRRQVLAGLGTLGVASAGAGLGTTALFTDTERTAGWYEAGIVDLKLDFRTTYRPWERYDLNPDEPRPPVVPGTDGMTYELGVVPQFRSENEPPLTHEEWGQRVREMVVCEGESGYDPELAGQLVDGEQCELFVELDDIKPKDEGETTFSLHLCGNPAYLLVRSLVEDHEGNPLPRFPENLVVEPERQAGDDDLTGDDAGELADYMHVTVFADADCDNLEDEGDTVLYAGSLRGWLDLLAAEGEVAISGDSTAKTGCFTPGTHCFVLRWVLPCVESDFRDLPSHADTVFDIEDPDRDGDGEFTFNDELRWRGHVVTDGAGLVSTADANVSQTDGVHFGLGFRAVQCRHNDGPSNWVGGEGTTNTETTTEEEQGTTTAGPGTTTTEEQGTTTEEQQPTTEPGTTATTTTTTTEEQQTTTEEETTTTTDVPTTTEQPTTTTTTSTGSGGSGVRRFSRRSGGIQFLPDVTVDPSESEVGCRACALPADPAPSEEFAVTGVDTSLFPSVGVTVQTPPLRTVDLESGLVCEDGCGRLATLEQVDAGDRLDVVFLLDVSAGMTEPLAHVQAQLAETVDAVETTGYDARYAVLVYADDDLASWDPTSRHAVAQDTGDGNPAAAFVDAATAGASVTGLSPGDHVGYGGIDGSQDGYEALVTASELPFRADAQQLVVQVTNSANEADGAGETRADAVAALAGTTYVAVSSNIDAVDQPKGLAATVGGTWIHVGDDDWSGILDAAEAGTRATYECWYVSPNETADGTTRRVSVGATVDGVDRSAATTYEVAR